MEKIFATVPPRSFRPPPKVSSAVLRLYLQGDVPPAPQRSRALEIASAALKIARADEKQRPVATLSEVIDRPPHESRRREDAASRFLRGEGA